MPESRRSPCPRRRLGVRRVRDRARCDRRPGDPRDRRARAPGPVSRRPRAARAARASGSCRSRCVGKSSTISRRSGSFRFERPCARRWPVTSAQRRAPRGRPAGGPPRTRSRRRPRRAARPRRPRRTAGCAASRSSISRALMFSPLRMMMSFLPAGDAEVARRRRASPRSPVRNQPSAVKASALSAGVEVAEEALGAARQDLALAAGRHRRAVVVDDADLGGADRAAFAVDAPRRRIVGAGGGDGRELGRAVDALGDAAEARGGLARPASGRRRRRRTRRGGSGETSCRGEVGMLGEVAQERRRAHHVGHALARRSARAPAPGSQRSISTALVPSTAGTRMAWTTPEMWVSGDGMRTASRGDEPVDRAEAARLGEQRLVRVQHALRVGGGARGVDERAPRRLGVGRPAAGGGGAVGERRPARACPAPASSRTTSTSRERRQLGAQRRRPARGGRSRGSGRGRSRRARSRLAQDEARARARGRSAASASPTAPRRAIGEEHDDRLPPVRELERRRRRRARSPSAASPPPARSARRGELGEREARVAVDERDAIRHAARPSRRTRPRASRRATSPSRDTVARAAAAASGEARARARPYGGAHRGRSSDAQLA